MQRRVFLAFAVLLCLPVVAQSALIVVGSNQLLPNTANQHVQIFITGTELINADNLAATVGNVATPSQTLTPAVDQSPTITADDVIGGAGFNPTIFTGNNLGNGGGAAPGPKTRTVENGTIAANPDGGVDGGGNPTFYTVTATGLFGTLVFDTTGIFAGALQKTWALRLGGPGNNTVALGLSSSDIGTDLNTNVIYPTVVDGNVFIPDDGTLDRPPDGPEPASIVLALFAAAGVAAVAIRRRRCA